MSSSVLSAASLEAFSIALPHTQLPPPQSCNIVLLLNSTRATVMKTNQGFIAINRPKFVR